MTGPIIRLREDYEAVASAEEEEEEVVVAVVVVTMTLRHLMTRVPHHDQRKPHGRQVHDRGIRARREGIKTRVGALDSGLVPLPELRQDTLPGGVDVHSPSHHKQGRTLEDGSEEAEEGQEQRRPPQGLAARQARVFPAQDMRVLGLEVQADARDLLSRCMFMDHEGVS